MKKIYTTIILSALVIFPAGSFAPSGIPCHPNTFWGFNGLGEVEEWLITGSSITSNGIVAPASTIIAYSLTFCDNLSGGTYSPTFYGHSGSQTHF